MKKIFAMLCKPSGAMSLGKALIFLFGLEILVMIPYITIIQGFPFSLFLAFFFLLFIVVVYSKTVDAKIDGRAVSVTVKDEVKENE